MSLIGELNTLHHRNRRSILSTACTIFSLSGILFFCILFSGCEKNFNIQLKNNEPPLVVEGYINNEMADYNYVILSKTQILSDNSMTSIPVKGASVNITSGIRNDNGTITWDRNSTITLKESSLPGISVNSGEGIYTDPNLTTNPSKALKGEPGKYYLLEIESEGRSYSSVTTLLEPIPIQLSTGDRYTGDDGISRGRINVHFRDPDTLGNRMLFFWKDMYNQDSFGWGSLGTPKRMTFSDEINNNNYIRLTHSYGFIKGDKITYLVAHVTREVFAFWDSYNKAVDEIGLLAIPQPLTSNIQGEDVTGCFSGFSISTATIIAD